MTIQIKAHAIRAPGGAAEPFVLESAATER